MEASEPVSESRVERRAARVERRRNPVLPPMATERRVPVVLATAVLALLLALATTADHALGAAAVAWLGLALAWGWPELLGSSSRFGSSLAVGVAGVLGPGSTPPPRRARVTKGEGALQPRTAAITDLDEERAAAEHEPL